MNRDMGAGSIPLPTGRSTLLKKAMRRLWRGTADSPANPAGLVAPQSRIVALMRFLPALENQSPKLARSSYRLLGALFDGDRIDLARIHTEQIDIGQGVFLSARIYVPETCLEGTNNPGLVYYHGGGCVIGDLDTHDVFCRSIAAKNDCIVISVAYRLAPEWRYPVPLLDAIAAWNWVRGQAGKLGLDLSRTGVGGDSAGGMLATTVCRQYLKPSLPVPVVRLPAFQWLIYPWLDCRQCTESAQQCVDGMVLTRATMSYFIQHYLGDGTTVDNPGASPQLCEDLTGMPPTYLATAGFDPLKDEGRIYAERLSAAEVSIRNDHFADVMHGFIGLCGVCPSSNRYILRMLQHLRELQEGKNA